MGFVEDDIFAGFEVPTVKPTVSKVKSSKPNVQNIEKIEFLEVKPAKVEKKEKPKVEIKSTDDLDETDSIYRIKDSFYKDLQELLGKERNKKELIPIINTLYLKSIDKVAGKFGRAY